MLGLTNYFRSFFNRKVKHDSKNWRRMEVTLKDNAQTPLLSQELNTAANKILLTKTILYLAITFSFSFSGLLGYDIIRYLLNDCNDNTSKRNIYICGELNKSFASDSKGLMIFLPILIIAAAVLYKSIKDYVTLEQATKDLATVIETNTKLDIDNSSEDQWIVERKNQK